MIGPRDDAARRMNVISLGGANREDSRYNNSIITVCYYLVTCLTLAVLLCCSACREVSDETIHLGIRLNARYVLIRSC